MQPTASYPVPLSPRATVIQRLGVERLGWMTLAVLILVYAAVAFTHLEGWSWNFDEGIAVQEAWLMRDGFRLYQQIWTDHTPGHPLLVSWAFAIGGVSLE